MRIAVRIAVCTFLLASGGLTIAAGDGLAANPHRTPPWARANIGEVASVHLPAWRSGLAEADQTGLRVDGSGLLGDHYFGTARSTDADRTSGFRATSGLLRLERRLFGGINAAASSDGINAERSTAAYAGVGYSRLASQGGWSFSADLGVVALRPGSVVRLGRSLGNSQGVDEALREMRLAPVLQLGVSYAF